MDRRRNRDRLSNLPDVVLVMIISNLPFKLAVTTSVLAKRWKNLHRETTNVAFLESEFGNRSIINDEETRREARVSFVRFMVSWVSRFSGGCIENFQISLSKTVGFEAEITSLIEFAVSKQVKNLVLDFSDPYLSTSKQAEAAAGASVFQLPECFYHLSSLVSLKLFACGFDPSRLAHAGSLKILCFGWIQLGKTMALLSRSLLLESLTIKNCWNLEAITEYNNRLRELIFENCGFLTEHSTLSMPNIQIFKYSGKLHHFQFKNVNRLMEEAFLDFGAETEHDEATGTALCGLLYGLSSARKLTVCPFLIKTIKDSEDPVRLRAPMETRHLVIKTNLVMDEFMGIRLMINSCPVLDTLTFHMLPPLPFPTTFPVFYPKKFWTYMLSQECVKNTLRVVEVRNFSGGTYELHILRLLIQWGLVLEKVDLYVPWRLPEGIKDMARATVRNLRDTTEASSDRLWIRLLDPAGPDY